MAASGFTPISLYYTATAAAVPVNTNLAAGELALNTTDGKLFYKDTGGAVQLLGTKGGVGSSTNTQVLYNSSGLVVGSASMTFDGTTITSAFAGPHNGTVGVTTANTGAFTTLTASTNISSTRINPRTSTTTSTATLTPDISAVDQYDLTAQAVALAVAAPIGTPVDGNKLILRILDNGTSQAITWDGTYTVIGTTLPTATVINKMTYVGCIYNSTNTRWDVVAVTTQA